ncbi:hypothetical protein GGS20DRAFT_54488 [Poronia punctata]|nr:hypothetical protein GGS20DRAFT_54488 [Poronia punctata]
MVAIESDAQDYKRKALLAAKDGGSMTVKSQMHDHVQGNRTWPLVYDARALIHPSYNDGEQGMTIEENEERYKAAKEKGDVSMLITWSVVSNSNIMIRMFNIRVNRLKGLD